MVSSIYGHISISRKDNLIGNEVSTTQTKNMQDKEELNWRLSVCLSGLCVKAQHSYQYSKYLKGQDYRKNPKTLEIGDP